jgi:cyclase
MSSDTPQTSPASPAARLHQVAPGIHAWVQPDGSWWLNNAGAVAGDDGALVIDTCASAARTRRFLAALDTATGGVPVRMAVNTHQHGDHTYGNSLLPAATVIIGHMNMREGLRVDRIIDGCPPLWSPVPDWGPVTRRLPDLTIESTMTVHVGDRRVEVLHPGGPAHTTGDLVAWLPEDAVLFSGDLVFAGLTPLRAARQVELGEFAGWADAERIVLNLHRVYADHAGHDLDLIAALGDAVAWLGHPMHTSV